MESCIFCKIIDGEIPANKAYEDADMLIFADIDPKAKLHYLLVPKAHYASLKEATAAEAELLGRCLKKLSALSDALGLAGGYRTVINKGADAGQSVEHLHVHVLGGEKLGWNPG